MKDKKHSKPPVPIVGVGASGGGEDATGQDRAAEERRKSEAFLLNLADTDPAMLWVTEPDGSCSFLSCDWYGFTGQTEQEAHGKGGAGWLDAVHPEDRERVWHIFLKANDRHWPFSLDYRLRRHDGEYRWAMNAGRPRFGTNGEFLGYIGSVLDIHERKQAEETLRESEEKYRTVFTSIDEGFCVVDMLLDEQGKPHDYLFLEINPMFEQLTGLRNAIGRTARELVPGLEEFWVEIYGRVALTGKPVRFEHYAEPMNRWFNVHASRVGDETSRHVAIVFTNITERKRAEVLLAAEKKVLGHIATGTALPEVLDTLMRETEAQSADGMLCSVLLADEKGQCLLHGAAPSLPPAYNAAVHGLVIGPSVGSCGTAAFERKPVFVTDIAADPRWAGAKDLAAAHGLGACHSTPILSSQGRLLGTIAMYYRRPHNPGAHDRQLIERATQLAGIAIERSQAEEVLRLAKFSVDRAADAVYWIDPEAKVLDVNEAASRMLGYSKDELCAMTVHDLNPDFQTDMWPGFWAETRKRGTMVIETCHKAKNGRLIPIEVSVNFLSYEGKEYHCAFVRDITERKRAEAALERSKTRFRAIFDQTFQFIGLMKTDGTVIEANRSALQFAGIREEDVLGKLFWDTPWWTHSPELQNRLREAVRQAAGGAMVRFEATHPGPTGELAYVDFSLKPVRDEHGNVTLLIPEGHNITERKRTEAALRKSEERYHSIFKNAVDGIFQTTADGKYVAVNPALARIYGYDSPDDLIATITDIAGQLYVDPKRRDVFLSLMQARKEVTGFESLVYRKDGSFMWISESARTLRDQSGTVVGYEGTVEDITERKLAEGRLRVTLDQVRALSGRLATMQEEERVHIARELHDELGVRLTCLKIDLSRVMSIVGNRVRTDLRTKLIDRIGSMIEQVDSTIAAVQRLVMELRPALLDNLGLVAAIEWQSQDFQKRTGISCTCVTNAGDIAMEPKRATAVFRIFQEALTNTARHAQATAVMITVTSQPDSLQMMVTDNGVGIPDTKVSDPQSLGLLGMQERAAQCGGTVTIAGNPDKGTTVTLCLPIGRGTA